MANASIQQVAAIPMVNWRGSIPFCKILLTTWLIRAISCGFSREFRIFQNSKFFFLGVLMSIERAIASIREDRRADYLFDTKIASEAVGCEATKYGDWWYRTRRKLICLAAVQPGELAAELALIIAEGAKGRRK